MLSRIIDSLRDAKEFFKKQPLLCALLINVVAFFISISVFDVKYETIDDFMTDAVLSGAYGNGYDPNLLWGNVILGSVLVLLYKLVPNISFYFVLLMVLGFAALTSIVYVLFKKQLNITTIVMAVLFLLFFVDDIYVLVQFTKISTAAGIAGGLLVLSGLWEANDHRLRMIVSGIILTVVGSMVRFDGIYLYGPFLLFVFLSCSLLYLSKDEKIDIAKLRIIGRNLLICVCLVALLFGLSRLGSIISNSDEAHMEFNVYHGIRFPITDQMVPDYEDIQNEYNALGLDETDWEMINHWGFVDRGIYDDDLLRSVAQINRLDSDRNTHSLVWIIAMFLIRHTLIYWAAIGVYVLALLCLVMCKDKVSPLLLTLLALILLAIFAYRGRMVYRVEWSIYLCAAASILAVFQYNSKSRLKTSVVWALPIILCLFIAIRVSMFLPVPDYRNMTDEEYLESFNELILDNSNDYCIDKYMFPLSERNPFQNIVSYMCNDEDHYYYIGFFTGVLRLQYAYDPWIRPAEGLFAEDFAIVGSVTMHHPGEIYALTLNGADPMNPYGGLTNENIYLVDVYYPTLKLDYIRKYYDPNAQIELVDEVDGLYIWNIYS